MIYQFENFSLDADRRELRRGTSVVATEPQVFDLINYLICNRDHVVTRDNLLDAVWHGRIVSESKDSITIVVDPENATKVVELKKSDIETSQPSKVSLMPKDLLKTLNEDEVRDLLAYLLSRGNPSDAMFRK